MRLYFKVSPSGKHHQNYIIPQLAHAPPAQVALIAFLVREKVVVVVYRLLYSFLEYIEDNTIIYRDHLPKQSTRECIGKRIELE